VRFDDAHEVSSEDKIIEGIQSLLQPGEQALAAMVGRPHGWSQAVAGSMVIGTSQQQRANDSADAAGFALASPMALAITDRRLLSLSMGAQVGMGLGGGVKELVGEAPLSDVDDVKVKRKLRQRPRSGSEHRIDTLAIRSLLVSLGMPIAPTTTRANAELSAAARANGVLPPFNLR